MRGSAANYLCESAEDFYRAQVGFDPRTERLSYCRTGYLADQAIRINPLLSAEGTGFEARGMRAHVEMVRTVLPPLQLQEGVEG